MAIMLQNLPEIAFISIADTAMFNSESAPTVSPTTFIADSGATSHMRSSLEGMYDLEDHNVEVTIGDKTNMNCCQMGKYKGMVQLYDGTSMSITLHDELYVPQLMDKSSIHHQGPQKLTYKFRKY